GCWPWPRWKPRGATVNSTLGVGTVPFRSVRYRNRFARPLDRGTGAPTGGRQEDLLGGRVERPHDALGVDGDDGVDGRVHDHRQPRLAFFERSFGLLLLRDVLENA